ncbi:TFIIS_C domain-containing protein/TFIIS_M domain-containing protein, partial [Cephalotus follicularis]
VGKRLRSLTKHPRKKIQAFAADLIEIWKNIVLEQTNRERNNGSLERTNSVKVGPENAENDKVVNVQKTTLVKDEDVSKVEPLKVEKIDRNGSANSEKSSAPKLTSMPKCNDTLRDRVREQLLEALSKVSGEADENIHVDVNACDPMRVAVSVESAMFEKWGRSNGVHKIKYRSTLFNMKDPKNPDFRRKVLLGHFQPSKVVTLSAEEMASDERQLQNEEIKKKALFDCEIGQQATETTDQFKCGRCGQRRTTYYQMQTRSADEPMTTYVTCVNCNHHWKFC